MTRKATFSQWSTASPSLLTFFPGMRQQSFYEKIAPSSRHDLFASFQQHINPAAKFMEGLLQAGCCPGAGAGRAGRGSEGGQAASPVTSSTWVTPHPLCLPITSPTCTPEHSSSSLPSEGISPAPPHLTLFPEVLMLLLSMLLKWFPVYLYF